MSDFASLGLSTPLLRSLTDLGYETPSPIQEQAIPVLLAGHSLLGTAQTGTGKTAAFALPMVERLDQTRSHPQVLVLTPTRELAIQVAEAFTAYTRYLGNIHVLPVYGGQDMRGQLRALNRGVQIIVGTPGRVLDHLGRGSLKLNDITGLVLDEADEMLHMGFIDDVEAILQATPDTCQRALFSATMPPAIKKVADTYLRSAKEIRIANKTATVERIQQSYVLVNNHHKLEALTRLLEVEAFDAALIFARTRAATTELGSKLEARGYAVAALNGDLTQSAREETIRRIKSGAIDIIVATDVAARGLDVNRVTHVLNYDIPYDPEAYVHRIGRTGRAGREGKAILFVAPKERRLLRIIENATRQRIARNTIPTGQEIGQRRLQQFEESLLDTLQSANLEEMQALVTQWSESHQIEPLKIAAALGYLAQRNTPLFPELKDISPQESSRRDRGYKVKEGGRSPGRQRGTRTSGEMDLYRIELGKEAGISVGDIVGAITNEAGIENRHIGKIRMEARHSTIELPKGMPKQIYSHLKKIRIRQKPVNMSLVGEQDAPRS